MLSLLELDVKESVTGLAPLVDFIHSSVAGQNLLAIDEECNCRLLPQLHTLPYDLVELKRLEVVGDQEPIDKQALISV